MHKVDIFSTMPAEFVGKYDIVHLRWFINRIKEDGPVPLLRKVISMLSKTFILWTRLVPIMISSHASVLLLLTSWLINHIEPGGYIQWDEHDPIEMIIPAGPALDPKAVPMALGFRRPVDKPMSDPACEPLCLITSKIGKY